MLPLHTSSSLASDLSGIKPLFDKHIKPNATNTFVHPDIMSYSIELKGEVSSDFTFDRNLNNIYEEIERAEGNYLFTSKGQKIFDACSGAAVSCLGHKNERVQKAVAEQFDKGFTYISSSSYRAKVNNEFCQQLIQGTDNKMARVYLTGSGSEANEAVIKLSRQYFYEKDKKTRRVNFISRKRSYHGNTLGALSLSGFDARREPYLPFLMRNVSFISACYQYRQQEEGESDVEFVAKKVAELEAKFDELGPDTVIGFIAEPIVGAALGCVPSPPGYLKAMREVCHKYGALFILDEVMCGMGRTGTLHAWQAEDVVPDIQTVAKGLAGGFQPVGAMLVSKKVLDVIMLGSGEFVHGLTFQGMPVQAVAGLEVQRIILERHLLDNVSKQGTLLGHELKDKLTSHPNVGDIRGRGLFWALEFVKDKKTKEPFDPNLKVAYGLMKLSMSEFNMAVYPSMGCKDGVSGDIFIIAPAYTVTNEDVKLIVRNVCLVVNTFFSRLLLGRSS